MSNDHRTAAERIEAFQANIDGIKHQLESLVHALRDIPATVAFGEQSQPASPALRTALAELGQAIEHADNAYHSLDDALELIPCEEA